MPQRVLHLCLLLPLAGFLFSVNIGGYDLWPPDEPRFAEVAREMMSSGDYLVPRVNGQPYQEKPPLLPWAMALASAPAGDVTETTARIPSVVSALAAVLFTYLLAHALFGPRAAWWSAIVMMTCYRVWWESRTGRTDMMLGASLAAALYFFWRWEEDRKRIWLAALLAALIVSAYAKGPMGLLFSGLFIVAFYWRQPASRRQMHWLIGAVLVVGAALLWYVPARLAIAGHDAAAAGSNMAGNLLSNTLGRFLGSSKAAWPGYYLETLPADLMPWGIFLPWTLWWVWRRRAENKMMRFLLCWTVPAFVFLSVSIGKQAQYLLPLFPAFAILIAVSVIELMDGDRARWRRVTGAVWGSVLLIAGLGAFAVLATPYRDALSRGVMAFAVLGAAFGAVTLYLAWRGTMSSLHVIVAAQTAVLLPLVTLLVFPVINEYKSAKEFCAPVRALAESGKELRLYSVGFSREEYIYYSRHFHEEALNDIIGADSMPGANLRKLAEQQKKARKLIAMSVEPVPVANIGAITPEERAALRNAIDQAIQEEGKHTEALKLFEGALQSEIDRFAARFAEPVPVFMFVQESDWRWISALNTNPPPCVLLRHESVGRRTVLLFTNPAGADAVKQCGAG